MHYKTVWCPENFSAIEAYLLMILVTLKEIVKTYCKNNSILEITQTKQSHKQTKLRYRMEI